MIMSLSIITLFILLVVLFYHQKDEINEYEWDKCCRSGDMSCCFNVGVLGQNKKEFKKAKKYYEIACDGGSADACVNYGNLFMKGIGVKKDDKVMVEYYEKACTFESGKACLFLSTIYSTGSFVEGKDIKKAVFYAKRACKLNEKMCFLEGVFLKNNQLKKADKTGEN